MRHLDLKNHPFERKFNDMMKTAREFARRKPTIHRKYIPEHITPKFDEQLGGWGMFNQRLNIWVGVTYDDYALDYVHPIFNTPEDAIVWYKTLI